jgi:colanic acid/amylovoran biosynthesis glycosyltransferase
MIIAHFTYFFPSLSETFILNQITGLIDRGHDIYIYANKSENNTLRHKDIDRYNLLAKTFYFGDNWKEFPNNFIPRYGKGYYYFSFCL